MTLLQDLRYGWRVALKNPGYLLVAVFTLAVGIAANTAVFGWIDSILLDPLPGVRDAATLRAVEMRATNGDHLLVSFPDFRDYREHLKEIEGMAMAKPDAFRVGEVDHSERVWGELVTGNYFDLLGVKPLIGRTFNEAEQAEKQGAAPVVLLGEGLWRRKYQADPALVGRTVKLNGQQMTVIGVVPQAFLGSVVGVRLEVWAPLTMAFALNTMPEWMQRDRGTRNLFGLVRMKAGVPVERAQAEFTSLTELMARVNGAQDRGLSGVYLPVWQAHFGAQAGLRDPLRLLMVVCGVVLLIVCANVANLLLARASVREKEFSLRLALGAPRSRLVRQLFAESLLLAAASAVAALPLIELLRRGLGYLVPSGLIPIEIDIRQDWRVFAFTAGVSLLACVLASLAPAWHTAKADLNAVLNEGGRGGIGGRGSQRLRSLLVGAEVALALVALVGAGLFARSFQLARETHPGFETAGVGVTHLGLASAGYSVEEKKLFSQRLRERLEAQPGVEAVSYADTLPMSITGTSWEDLTIQGYAAAPGENMKLYRSVVAPGYFAALKIPLREGRDFTEQDTQERDLAMIVNETFVRRYLPDRQVLGTKVKGWGKWFTVVGVVADSKYMSQAEAPRPFFYVPFRQLLRADMPVSIVVRGQGGEAALLEALRREARALDPKVSLFDTMPLAEYIGAALLPQRVAAALLGVLGAIALLLAGVGLYSVMSYSMAQRTREIGIRLALGASNTSVLGLVLGQGLRMTLAGVAAGALLAALLAPLSSALLVKVSALDPWIFGGSILFLVAVGLAAAYMPARRAMKVDPNEALRCQ